MRPSEAKEKPRPVERHRTGRGERSHSMTKTVYTKTERNARERRRRLAREVLTGLEFVAILVFACGLPGWLDALLTARGW